MHRRRGIISSGLMTMFWLVCTMLAIPQFLYEVKGYHQRNIGNSYTDSTPFADYQFFSFSVHILLLVLVTVFHFFADQNPVTSRYRNSKTDKKCPELNSSFVSKMFYFWFEPVMWKSYRRALTADDMFDIKPEDTSANLNPRFEKNWKLEVDRKSMTKTTGLRENDDRINKNTNV